MFNIGTISPNRLTMQLEQFRSFLIASWPYLNKLMEKHDWVNDKDFIDNWIEINWEFLVERELFGKIGTYLAPLSASLSDRILNKEVCANYSVVAQLNIMDRGQNPRNCQVRFIGFCTASNEGYKSQPPFDQAKLIFDATGEQFFAPFLNLEFYLMKI